MTHLRAAPLAVACVVLIAIVVLQMSRADVNAKTGGAEQSATVRRVIELPAVSLGDISATDGTRQVSAIVCNRTEQLWRIATAVVSCGSQEVGLDRHEIAPGDCVQITCELDLRYDGGPEQTEVLLTLQGGTESLRVPIEYFALGRAFLSPNLIDVACDEEGEFVASAAIQCDGCRDDIAYIPTSITDALRVMPLAAVRATPWSMTIPLAVSGRLAAGRDEMLASVGLVEATDTAQPKLVLTVHAARAVPLQVSPSRVVCVTSQSGAEITLRCIGQAGVSIADVDVLPSDLASVGDMDHSVVGLHVRPGVVGCGEIRVRDSLGLEHVVPLTIISDWP